VVKGSIRSQVKDGPPSHASTEAMYSDGPVRRLEGALRREEVLLAQLRGGRSILLGAKLGKGSKGWTLCAHVVGRRRRT
jgi:hypothetical protein